MNKIFNPRVSVIVPAYNQAEFLAEAIQSVLDQTYADFELIVVNDCSPDHTSEIFQQFSDPRLKYIEHRKNRGLPATRNTGMRASLGEYIALLDADDIFHAEKLKSHINIHQQDSEYGVTYNNRFNLCHSSNEICELWRPPGELGFADLICGFPFSPSDIVLKREWAFRVDLFDERFVSGGEDLDFQCRLALAGCKFARVDRALNFRRYHSGRRKRNLPSRLTDYTNALDRIFDNPRCPEEIRALRNAAFANHYLELVFLALSQEETELGQFYIRDAVRFSPTLLEGEPCPLIKFLLANTIADEGQDHGDLLRKILNQLPSDFTWLSDQFEWAITQGYLQKGARAVLWERTNIGALQFEHAAILNAKIDKRFLRGLAYQIINFEVEFGQDAAEDAFSRLAPYVKRLGGDASVRWLRGELSVNRGLYNYKCGNRSSAYRQMLRAIVDNPIYAINRGVWSVLIRSLHSPKLV